MLVDLVPGHCAVTQTHWSVAEPWGHQSQPRPARPIGRYKFDQQTSGLDPVSLVVVRARIYASVKQEILSQDP